MRNRLQTISNQSGFSLVGAIVAVAIISIGVVSLSKLMTNSSRFGKSVELRADRNISRTHIYDNISCAESLPSNPIKFCKGGGRRYIPITNRNGIEIVKLNPQRASDGTRFGEWDIRASCNGTDEYVTVEARRTYNKNGAKVGLNDPLTGKKQGEWVDLYPGYYLCNDELSEPKTPIDKDEVVYIEYYRYNTFKVHGGDVRLRVRRVSLGGIRPASVCQHGLMFNNSAWVGYNADFGEKILKKDQMFRLKIKVGPRAGLCEDNGTYEFDLTHKNVILTNPGRNIYHFRLEDHIEDFDYNDSVWRLEAIPITQ